MQSEARESGRGRFQPTYTENQPQGHRSATVMIHPERPTYPPFTNSHSQQPYTFDNRIPEAIIRRESTPLQEDVSPQTRGAPPGMLFTRYRESSQRNAIRDGQQSLESISSESGESRKKCRHSGSELSGLAAINDDGVSSHRFRVRTFLGTDNPTTTPHIDIYSSSQDIGRYDHHRTNPQILLKSASYPYKTSHNARSPSSSPPPRQRFLTFRSPPEDSERPYFSPAKRSSFGSGSQPSEPKYRSHPSTRLVAQSSISMSSTDDIDWTRSVPENAYSGARHQIEYASRESADSLTQRTTLASESSYYTPHAGIDPSGSTTTSSFRSSGKKKSKMHECEVCGKMFPRPSGLRTHMNTHNNVKPFPCAYPGCPRSFAVRSNAKRHLRTHAAIPTSSLNIAQTPTPYVVDFRAPTILPHTPVPTHQMSKAPFRLRWVPPSLITRTNAASLRSTSDSDQNSDDDSSGDDDNEGNRSAISIPLRAVVPSSHTTDDDDQYEERNSYIDVGSHPYHPVQFNGALPGPAALAPCSFPGSLSDSILYSRSYSVF